MKNIWVIGFALMLLALPSGLRAETADVADGADASDTYEAEADAGTVLSPDNTAHPTWQFIGCVHDHDAQHECSDLAHDHGYHHHRASHDHHRCPEHDHTYACWAKH